VRVAICLQSGPDHRFAILAEADPAISGKTSYQFNQENARSKPEAIDFLQDGIHHEWLYSGLISEVMTWININSLQVVGPL
jgi:hypothetical protein